MSWEELSFFIFLKFVWHLVFFLRWSSRIYQWNIWTNSFPVRKVLIKECNFSTIYTYIFCIILWQVWWTVFFKELVHVIYIVKFISIKLTIIFFECPQDLYWCVPSVFRKLARSLSILLTFSKNYLLVLLIFPLVCLFFIRLLSILYFLSSTLGFNLFIFS